MMKYSLEILMALLMASPLFAAKVPQDDASYIQSDVPLEVDTRDPSLNKVVLLAGRRSHASGEHEHFAGCALLMNMLKQNPGIFPVMAREGWPQNPGIFDGAKTIVVYADGGGGHPLLQGDRLQIIGDLMKKGVGLVCIHYACEPTQNMGEKEFLDWIGGAFSINWSVNPHWLAEFKDFPVHPITRGVNPFKMQDEWYFHMRFPEDMEGTTPILSAVAPLSTMSRGDGAHSGNPAVRKAVAAGLPQHMAWACERPDGARGFGFTGAHFHQNWADPDFRRTVVNAILWTANVDVPKAGANCNLAETDLYKHLDDKR